MASEREEVATLESLQYKNKIHRSMSTPVTDNVSSFTTLFELPATQAIQLIHSPDSTNLIVAPTPAPNINDIKGAFNFPFNSGLIERAMMFSLFCGDGNINDNDKINSPEPMSYNSIVNLQNW
ncbi:hypothetical protein GQ457_08G027010 [Hibiscus cannabinus]